MILIVNQTNPICFYTKQIYIQFLKCTTAIDTRNFVGLRISRRSVAGTTHDCGRLTERRPTDKINESNKSRKNENDETQTYGF